MTDPPEKATRKAPLRLVRAAAAVRTLAAVATRMPKNPASPEQTAPASTERPTSAELPSLPALAQASSPATTRTKMARTRYSRPRNAMAPSRMCPAISCMRSSPASCLLIQRLRTQPKARANTPATGTQNIRSCEFILSPSGRFHGPRPRRGHRGFDQPLKRLMIRSGSSSSQASQASAARSTKLSTSSRSSARNGSRT